MIARVFLAARRKDLTTEACLEYWRGPHAVLGSRLPLVRSYVQNHGVLDGGRFLLPYPGFDIIPENDFDDLKAMDTAIESHAHKQDLLEDEGRFLDTARTSIVVTQRHVLDDAPAPADSVKLITLFRRSPGAAQADFEKALLSDYAPTASVRGHLRHEMLVTVGDRVGKPPSSAQAIELLWFATPRDALLWTVSDTANRAAWFLAGAVIGCERLIARPHKVI
jgi:hypothetical protein